MTTKTKQSKTKANGSEPIENDLDQIITLATVDIPLTVVFADLKQYFDGATPTGASIKGEKFLRVHTEKVRPK